MSMRQMRDPEGDAGLGGDRRRLGRPPDMELRPGGGCGGVEVARRIRDAARFKLGQRNEQIVQFNVVPLRRRPRANVEPPAPEPAPEIAAVETTEPEP